jgi:hypothetical protein
MVFLMVDRPGTRRAGLGTIVMVMGGMFADAI